MKCTLCGINLLKIDRREDIDEFNEDMTEAQESDYEIALETEDYGEWVVGIVEYKCPRCDRVYENIFDSLNTFQALIRSWHIKAKNEDDFFSKFVFEYLGFSAHLRNNLYPMAYTDRNAIQRLKSDDKHRISFCKIVEADVEFKNSLDILIKELNEKPLLNSSIDPDYPEIDGRWNDSQIGKKIKGSNGRKEGVIHSSSDWENIIEFCYGVRNNLFHGGKDPDVGRDIFLVSYAYKILCAFMEEEIRDFFGNQEYILMVSNEEGHS